MIVAPAEIYTFLGLTSPSDAERGKLNLLQRLVESRVKKFLGYAVEQGTHTEFLPALEGASGGGPWSYERTGSNRVVMASRGGGRALQLSELPVRSITSLYEDPGAYGGQAPAAFAAASLLVEGTDFYRDLDRTGLCKSGLLWKVAGGWSGEPRSIKVTYVAGYTADELAGKPGEGANAADIKLAVLTGLQELWTASDSSAGVQSESLADYSVTYSDSAAVSDSLSRSARQMLGPFRSYARYLE